MKKRGIWLFAFGGECRAGGGVWGRYCSEISSYLVQVIGELWTSFMSCCLIFSAACPSLPSPCVGEGFFFAGIFTPEAFGDPAEPPALLSLLSFAAWWEGGAHTAAAIFV